MYPIINLIPSNPEKTSIQLFTTVGVSFEMGANKYQICWECCAFETTDEEGIGVDILDIKSFNINGESIDIPNTKGQFKCIEKILGENIFTPMVVKEAKRQWHEYHSRKSSNVDIDKLSNKIVGVIKGMCFKDYVGFRVDESSDIVTIEHYLEEIDLKNDLVIEIEDIISRSTEM